MSTNEQPYRGDVSEAIDVFRRRARTAGIPCGMVLAGQDETGAVRAYAAAHPPITVPGGAVSVPVLFARVPGSATAPSLTAALLGALATPTARRLTSAGELQRLIATLHDRAVELIILDKAENLKSGIGGPRSDVCVAWLKLLVKATRIPFVLAGTVAGLEGLLHHDTHLSRLFQVHARL